MIKPLALLSLAALWVAGPAWADCEQAGPAEIYPTAKILPENLLRIYIYFPRPMDLGQGIEMVRLLDAEGAPVEQAFLSNREDLWSPDRRRLTLLLNPGRVKTGLDAHEELGRALAVGQYYAFEVSGTSRDADGCPLGADTRHEFEVGAADFETPSPSKWQLSPVQALTRETLEVGLGSSHDHLSLAFRLRVLDANGVVVPGRVALGEGEASWFFTPKTAWKVEPYTLSIDERLEDLAGNRPGLLFDRPLNKAPSLWENTISFTPLE